MIGFHFEVSKITENGIFLLFIWKAQSNTEISFAGLRLIFFYTVHSELRDL